MPPVRVRGLEPADGEALTALVERARDAGELLGSSAPHGEWVVPLALAQPSQVAVAEVAGSLAGVVLPEVKALVVEPGFRRRGIGRALVGAGLAIERERGRPELLLGILPGDAPGRAFLAATGFSYHSTVWDLELVASAPVPAAVWPDGFTARAFDRSRDLEPWVALFNVAFAEHATPLTIDEATWRATWDDPTVADDDVLVVVGPAGGLVGFCATDSPHVGDGSAPRRGEIWTIGVAPEHRGRGLGRQLLRWGVARLRGLGVATVRLAVSARNPAALALYESDGFGRTTTRDRWARPVEPRA